MDLANIVTIEACCHSDTGHKLLTSALTGMPPWCFFCAIWLKNVIRAKQSKRLPAVPSRLEVTQLLNRISGTNGLIARLLYGTGMRQMECLRLRVKDIDFHYH